MKFVILKILGKLYNDFILVVLYFISIKVKYKFECFNFYLN